jgi:hypothetical protein
MPQKLDWADRHLFVATREGRQYVDALLERTAAYTRALARLAAQPRKRKATTTLDGRTVTKREIKSLLTKLERKPPQTGFFLPRTDIAKYNRLKNTYERALAKCDAPESIMCYGTSRTKSEIQSLLMKSYKDACKNKARFQSWSQFVRNGPPTKPLTILYSSSELTRAFFSLQHERHDCKIGQSHFRRVAVRR